MCWHENIQNKSIGLGGRPPVSTWNMCRASNNLESVEPTITKKYKRACWTKNYQEESVGIGGWPPISIWISPPPKGSNDIHCFEFFHQVRKLLLNLAPGEPLSLVEELSYLDNPIKLDPLLMSALDLCVHYMISGWMFHPVRVDLCWCHLFFDLWGVQ